MYFLTRHSQSPWEVDRMIVTVFNAWGLGVQEYTWLTWGQSWKLKTQERHLISNSFFPLYFLPPENERGNYYKLKKKYIYIARIASKKFDTPSNNEHHHNNKLSQEAGDITFLFKTESQEGVGPSLFSIQIHCDLSLRKSLGHLCYFLYPGFPYSESSNFCQFINQQKLMRCYHVCTMIY
jgi:hypothetical protein